jgi:hypothetical protein
MSVKRPGQEQYSSDGYHLTVEMEAEVTDANHFRAVTQALFAEVKSTLEAEVADGSPSSRGSSSVDLWTGPGGNGGADRKPTRTRRDSPSDTSTRERSRSHTQATDARITNKQAKFALGLARKAGLANQAELGSFIREKLGVEAGLYELTRRQGSALIDLLNNGSGGNGQ